MTQMQPESVWVIFSEETCQCFIESGIFGDISKQTNEWNLCPLSYTADFSISFQPAASIVVLPARMNYAPALLNISSTQPITVTEA